MQKLETINSQLFYSTKALFDHLEVFSDVMAIIGISILKPNHQSCYKSIFNENNKTVEVDGFRFIC